MTVEAVVHRGEHGSLAVGKRIENGVGEVDGGCLALGAGDAEDGELPFGV